MEMLKSVENLHEKEDDMAEQPRNIQQYFSGATVFVTGATGFLGRLLVEKLLRTCTELRKIYILMRPKKDKSCEERFQEYFDNIVYDLLKRSCPKALEKVCIISGDCSLPDLGISEKDRQVLISEVNCIFHAAATVRFDEKLRTATYTNVRGTRDVLQMAKQVKSLSALVYISTAFSFCPREEIGEEFYEPKITGEQLMTLVETFGDNELDELTPTFLGEWPNTYSFTKSIAEDVVRREGSNLPVAMVRPGIVVATAKEPIAGWMDNFYGLNGVMAGAGLGLLQTLHCEPNYIAEAVPVDYVVNSLIAAAWDVANSKRFSLNEEVPKLTRDALQENLETNIPVYNYVSSPQKPLLWKQCTDYGFERGGDMPSVKQVWHHCFRLNSNKYVHLFSHYILHIALAHIMDFFARCLGKQPRMVKAYEKISKFLAVITFFTTRRWVFSNKNTQELWKKLSAEDKKQFEFDMSTLEWKSYFYTYAPGLRVYLVKDPMETVPQGRAWALKLKIAHYTLVSVLLLGFSKLLLLLWNVLENVLC